MNDMTQWYRRGWFIGGTSFIFGLVVGAASAESAPTTTVTQAAPTRTVTQTVTAKPAGAAVMIAGDGTYVVGKDIQPGTYRSAGDDLCYWARLKSTDGGLGAIIANNAGSGRQVVTIKKTDAAFETRGCGNWTR